MPTLTMQAPNASYTQISARDGSIYRSDAAGLVSNVDVADAQDLINAGWQVIGPGFATFRESLFRARNSDGSAVAAAASSGKFGFTVTPGTTECLISEVANNNSKTDVVAFDIEIPASFPANYKPNVTVNCNHVIGSGTLSVHTIAAALYSTSDAGVQGSNIIVESAQNTPAAAGDVVFTTNAGLQPGQRVMLVLTMVLTETSTHNTNGQINSVRFS